VILMYLMQVSDVAHTMQDFATFVKWNHRLFNELYSSHCVGRGADCFANWYLDQIAFLDSYIIPLARRIKNCGVLGSFGSVLLSNAMENKRRWTDEGKIYLKQFFRLRLAF